MSGTTTLYRRIAEYEARIGELEKERYTWQESSGQNYSRAQDAEDREEKLERRIAKLEEQWRYQNKCNVELHMLARKWMVAHDSLAAGVPYEFPSPADVPECEKRIEELEAHLFKASNLIHQIRQWANNGIPNHPEGPGSMREHAEMVVCMHVVEMIDESQPPLAVTDDEKTALIKELEAELRDCVTRMDRARSILQGKYANWAMLDTKLARKALRWE